MTIGALAAATPPSRDRFLDLLRASSIALVVVGHFTIAAVVRADGGLRAANALSDVGWLRAVTWVFQVMPVFFFVAGVTNAHALGRDGASVAGFVRRRVDRLWLPTMSLVVCWLVLATALPALGVDEATSVDVAHLAVQPLWFLAVYVALVAIAPTQLRVHCRRRWLLVVALPVVVVLLDVVRLSGVGSAAADLNYVAVFMFAQELGFFYRDGLLARLKARTVLGVAIASLGVLLILAVSGLYPVSMVGVPGQAVSNMSPPTVCIVLLTVAQLGILLAARARITRWLDGPRAWRSTVAANGIVLTVFLWHLSAYVAASALLVAAGWPLPPPGSGAWWWGKPVFLGVGLIVLAVLLSALAPLERRALRPRVDVRTSRVAAYVAAIGLAAGYAAIAATDPAPVLESGGRHIFGVAVSPAAGLALLVGAWGLAHLGARRTWRHTGPQ